MNFTISAQIDKVNYVISNYNEGNKTLIIGDDGSASQEVWERILQLLKKETLYVRKMKGHEFEFIKLEDEVSI